MSTLADECKSSLSRIASLFYIKPHKASFLLSYRLRLTVYCRPLSYERSLKEWLGYELINSQEMRSGRAPDHPYCLIACSVPNFGFRLLQRAFSQAVPWYSCVSSSLQGPLLNASGYTTPALPFMLKSTSQVALTIFWTPEIKKHIQKDICILGP